MVSHYLKKINVVPLAAESFGVRSMCTYVETPDVRVLVDPGVSLGKRFMLIPHPREYVAIRDCRKRILDFADKVDVVTISHYHFDHSTPIYTDYVWNWSSLEEAEQIYRNKLVLAKAIRRNINYNQRRRGWMLQKTAKPFMGGINDADGRVFTFGETRLEFSEAVFHGEMDTPLGWVLMLTIECQGERIIHASDVQGPVLDETLKIILAKRPHLVIIGGPPTYLAGFRVKAEALEQGLRNLVKIAESVPVTILEHHLLRDGAWREFAAPAFEAAKKFGHVVNTAAEFVGKPANLLEYQRKRLYEIEPPSVDFMKWTKLPRAKQKMTKPPT